MPDAIARSLDKASILLGVPVWIILLSLVFLIVMTIGIRLLARNNDDLESKLNWRRDPEEMTDLSPNLRRARMQMIGAGLGMVALLFIALLSLLQD
jgi:Fe2+ transport system protein B